MTRWIIQTSCARRNSVARPLRFFRGGGLPAALCIWFSLGISSGYAAIYSLPASACPKINYSFISVTIGNILHAPSIQGQLHYNCTIPKARYPLKTGQQVAFCWHIHGSKDYDEYGYRASYNGKAAIKFNFYAEDYLKGKVRVGTLRTGDNVTGFAKCNGQECAVTSPATVIFEQNEGAALPSGTYI